MVNPIKELETFANQLLEKSKKGKKVEMENLAALPQEATITAEQNAESINMEKSLGSQGQGEDLTKSLLGAVQGLATDMKSNRQEWEENLSVIAKSLQAMLATNEETQKQTQSQIEAIEKSMESRFEKLCQQLDTFLAQPTGQKSIQNIQAVPKNFAKSIGSQQSELSKSQVLNVLTQELYKGNPMVSTLDIVGIESGSPLRPELQSLVQNAIKQ